MDQFITEEREHIRPNELQFSFLVRGKGLDMAGSVVWLIDGHIEKQCLVVCKLSSTKE